MVLPPMGIRPSTPFPTPMHRPGASACGLTALGVAETMMLASERQPVVSERALTTMGVRKPINLPHVYASFELKAKSAPLLAVLQAFGEEQQHSDAADHAHGVER